MSALTLLLPARAQLKAAALARWLARGDRLPDAAPGRAAQLRECFEFLGASLPLAALTRSLDADDAATALWLRADPCHVRADTVAVRMLACGDLGLTSDECDELAGALRPLFGDAGFPLEATRPDRWYLRCPRTARLPRFADPESVLGDDLMQHLPRGDNERQWRHLLNEAQVILHNHPLNARRARLGQVPVNSLWFWGAGGLPDWVRTPYTRIVSKQMDVAALAKLARQPVADDTPARLRADEVLLLDCTDGAAAAVDGAGVVDLRFASGERYRYKAWHRWRFWRRARA